MFEDVRRLLAAAGVPLDDAEFLDALWLACALAPGAASPLGGLLQLASPGDVDAASSQLPEESGLRESVERAQPLHASPPQASHADPTPRTPPPLRPEPGPARQAERTAQKVWMPGANALPDSQLIGRAFRPVKHRALGASAQDLDEIATADVQAETRIALPILRPRMERWARVALVIDGGLPMLLWERVCTELATSLARSAAFRQITIHQIRYTQRKILVGQPWTAAPASRTAASLTDPTGSTMMLVLSDGASPAWRDGRMQALLNAWAAVGPTAILHTLPRPFWAGTSVDGDIWSVSAPAVGAPNASWRIAHPFLPRALATFERRPIPVLPLTAAGLITWAALTTAAERPATLRLWEPDRPAPAGRDAGNMREFGRTASPEAVRLAAHLAAVAPLTVPVMQLVDAGIPGGPDSARLAEVLLSGLLLPATTEHRAPSDPRHLMFDFAPEVKDALLDELPTDELVKSSIRIGEQLEKLAGRSRSFPAWLAHDRTPEGAAAGSHPFAHVSPAFLKRFAAPAALDMHWPTGDALRAALRTVIEDSLLPYSWKAIKESATNFARAHRRDLTDELIGLLRGQFVEFAAEDPDGSLAGEFARLRAQLREMLGESYAQGPHSATIEYLLFQLLRTSEGHRETAPSSLPSLQAFATEISMALQGAGLDIEFDPSTATDMICRTTHSSIPLEIKAAPPRPRLESPLAAPVSFLIVADSTIPEPEHLVVSTVERNTVVVVLNMPVLISDRAQSSTATPPQSSRAGGRRFVYSAGVSTYQSDPMSLPEAAPDSDTFAALLAQLGYQRILVEYSRDPTADVLRNALRGWLRTSNVGPDDHLVVYFAGHGHVIDGQHHLVAHDSDPSNAATQVTVSDLYDSSATNAPRILLVLDTCYGSTSGAALEERIAAQAVDPRIMILTSAHQIAADGSFMKALSNILSRRIAPAHRFVRTMEIVKGVNSYFRIRGTSQRARLFGHDPLGDDTFFPNPVFNGAELSIEDGPHTAIEPYTSTIDTAGEYFTGRVTALRDVSRWLFQPILPGQTLCVVTGGSGSGKSALLDRLVADSERIGIARDAPERPRLIPERYAVVALNAQRMTLQKFTDELGDALDLSSSYADDVHAELVSRTKLEPLLIVIDSLDQATEEVGIAALLDRMHGLPGVLIVVGTRTPTVLSHGEEALAIDLDEAPYFSSRDIAAYTGRLLSELPDSPFLNLPDLVDRLGTEMASISGASFRTAKNGVAIIINDVSPAADDGPEWRETLRMCRARMLEALWDGFDSDGARAKAKQVLLPLAYSIRPQVPDIATWAQMASYLAGRHFSPDDVAVLLYRFGFHAPQVTEWHSRPGYSGLDIFREVVSEVLRAPRDESRDHARIADAFLDLIPPMEPGQDPGIVGRAWETAPAYVLANLATHAALATRGTVERVIAVPGFLSHADPRSIYRALSRADSDSYRAFAAVFEDGRMAELEPGRRDQLLAIAAARTSHPLTPALGRRAHRPVLWVIDAASANHAAGEPIQSIVPAFVDGQQILAAGVPYNSVGIWTVRNGGVQTTSWTVLQAGSNIRGIAVARSLSIGASARLVTIQDTAMSVWDLRSEARQVAMDVHFRPTGALACIASDGKPLAVTGAYDGTARVWDLDSGIQRGILSGHRDAVHSVECIDIDGRPHAVTASRDGSVRVWDLRDLSLQRVIIQSAEHDQTIACTTLDRLPCAVIGSSDGSVGLWDLRKGTSVTRLTHLGGRPNALTCAEIDGRPSAVFCGDDRILRIWDLRTRMLTGIDLPEQATAVAWSGYSLVVGMGSQLVALGASQEADQRH